MSSNKRTGSSQPIPKPKAPVKSDRKPRRGSIFYPALALIACLAAGSDFLEQRKSEPIRPSQALTTTRWLSDYLPSLRRTRGDSELYIFDSRKPGGTLLVLGGTHPNEPAGYMAALLMVENLQVEQGRVVVIPRANASGFTATEPQEAYPETFEITSKRSGIRSFRVGSRFTNILDGWPDPVVYRHRPSGQLLSGNETRNLNRAYPGRPNGTLTERIACAITEVVKREQVDLVIDLHEAAPEYPVINAIVAHERAMDIAAMATVDLQSEGLDFRLEPSPANFHGLSHRELGDWTPAKCFLIESAGALQGRIRAATNADLVTRSQDPCYHRASQLGKLQIPFPAEGIPLEVRIGRQLEAIKVICRIQLENDPEHAITFNRIPTYEELESHGIGFYLR